MRRRDVLTAALSVPAVALAGSQPLVEMAGTADRMPALVADWKIAITAFNTACNKPDGGNFDTPECLKWSAEQDRLSWLIEETPISSYAGAAALIEYAWLNYASLDRVWADVPGWLLTKLQVWAEARALVA